uniref:Uncharacterized protein n=1 Tax=Arundo donax TaxID=35708 RepID=A0A0A9D2C5_ARUDO
MSTLVSECHCLQTAQPCRSDTQPLPPVCPHHCHPRRSPLTQ